MFTAIGRTFNISFQYLKLMFLYPDKEKNTKNKQIIEIRLNI